MHFFLFSPYQATSEPLKSRKKAKEIRKIAIRSKNRLDSEAYIGTIDGQRGNPKIVLNGYSFIPNKRTNEKTYWNCAQVRQKRCRARLITVGTVDNIFVTNEHHSHEKEFAVEK